MEKNLNRPLTISKIHYIGGGLEHVEYDLKEYHDHHHFWCMRFIKHRNKLFLTKEEMQLHA